MPATGCLASTALSGPRAPSRLISGHAESKRKGCSGAVHSLPEPCGARRRHPTTTDGSSVIALRKYLAALSLTVKLGVRDHGATIADDAGDLPLESERPSSSHQVMIHVANEDLVVLVEHCHRLVGRDTSAGDEGRHQ